MLGTTETVTQLQAQSERLKISPALALGLGAGLYFQYFRRPQPSPTHSIEGLNPNLADGLARRIGIYRVEPNFAVQAALRENALWFNLDRAPTTGLLGMEMLAEELPHFDAIADWRTCLDTMTQVIENTNSLHRRTFVKFLNEVLLHIPAANGLIPELNSIADDWDTFSANLRETANITATPNLEALSRQIRRLAFREEHFWGTVLESVKG